MRSFLLSAIDNCTGDKCLDKPSVLGIPTTSIEGGANSIIGIIIMAAGILSVIFIVIGGIKYASSGGDPQRIQSAKNTLTYAIIGLAVAILARMIISFVLFKGPS